MSAQRKSMNGESVTTKRSNMMYSINSNPNDGIIQTITGETAIPNDQSHVWADEPNSDISILAAVFQTMSLPAK